MRVVSLLAGATEIVCALGAGEMLVGRSHECDNPSWVRGLPACSEPAFDISVSSRGIDAEVRRRLHAGEPLYHIDMELIRKLQPDLVITQSHCDVCAVTPADLERGSCALAAPSLRSRLRPSSKSSAAFCKSPKRWCSWTSARRHRSRAAALGSGAAADCAVYAVPAVVLLEWTDPFFAMGNWGPELVEIANGEPLLGHPGEFSTAIPGERASRC